MRWIAFLALLVVTACNGGGRESLEATSPVELESPANLPVQTSAASTPSASLESVDQPTSSTTSIPTIAVETDIPAPSREAADLSIFTWKPIINGLRKPLGLENAGDGSSRLFLLEQAGLIRILQAGNLIEPPFLDLTDRVGSSGLEQGLLGLAFHPNYRENGYFYVNYTDLQGDTVIARFQVSQTDPNIARADSEMRLLLVEQPYENHNGGAVLFGPDGYLYIGLGDGGSAGDPHNNAQSLDTLLGKILRVDVDQGQPYGIPKGNPYVHDGGRAEIWANGLRNPWRMAFDALTGDLYIGDVGQNQWEEINFLPAEAVLQIGRLQAFNFGWNYSEGTHVFQGDPPLGLAIIPPVAEYDHTLGCSVTGGVVYRGSQLSDLQGIYLFGDYCSGRVWGLWRTSEGNWQKRISFENMSRITAFGEDESGEVFLSRPGRVNIPASSEVTIMDEKFAERVRRFQGEKRINGLIYGLIAGFWFSLGVWALDAWLLQQANGDFTWLKFAIGAPFLIFLGGVAGWLTARFDNSFLGALIWLATGIAYIWICSHVPFQGQSIALGLLDLDFAGLELYPFVESIVIRMSLLYLVVGLLMAIFGGFELFFVESATRSSGQFGRFFALLICFILYIPLGMMVDDLINRTLREPIAGMNELIQFGVGLQNQTVSKETQREMGVRAIRIFGDRINRPYRIILGKYDPIMLDEIHVYVDFSGEWGGCSVLVNRPMVCWLSSERYLRSLACLVEGGTAQKCKIKTLPGAEPVQMDVFAKLDAEPLEYGILGQRGTQVLVMAADAEGDQVKCNYRELDAVYLESCQPVNGKAFDIMPILPTPTRLVPTPTPTVMPIQEVQAGPQAALSDPSVLGLAVLQNAPRYTIVVDINEDLLGFNGSATVEVTNAETVPLDVLYFRLLPNGKGSYGDGSLRVTRTSQDGREASTALLVEDTVLKVPLTETLQPGEKVLLEFEFQGEVPKDFGGEATPAGYGIYNLSNGVLALSGWYPILAVYDDQGWNLDQPSQIGDSVYSDVGFYSVDLSAPEGLMVAATGVKVSEQHGDGKQRMHFESGPERDFFLVASADYQMASRMVGETKVNSYFFSGHEAAGMKALSIASDSLKIFNEKFGPYPFGEFDVVAAPMRNALGVEYPGIVVIAESLYELPEKPDFEVTVAHEVAHQWWYSVVGNDVFDEPWLDEALVTYSSGLYYEFTFGPQYQAGLEQYWQNRYDRQREETGDEIVTNGLEYFESLNRPSIYGAIVYVKGALFFKALRAEIGDQAFFQGLQDYYQLRYFQIAQAADLLDAFENAAGRNLDTFYQQWLYKKQ